MEYRDELDKAAKMHGWENREPEADCEHCIHQPMCSGNNCHFDRDWEPKDLVPKFYHVNDWDDRLSDKLYSMRDRAESEDFKDWPSDLDGPYFMEKREWERIHHVKPLRVRIEIVVDVDARDDLDAERLAREECGITGRFYNVETYVLRQYRMPVEYLCCEEGRTYGYQYQCARSASEARYLFETNWVEDIESRPCFNDIEVYNEEDKEWDKA